MDSDRIQSGRCQDTQGARIEWPGFLFRIKGSRDRNGDITVWLLLVTLSHTLKNDLKKIVCIFYLPPQKKAKRE